MAVIGDFQKKQCHPLLIGGICMNTTKNFVPLRNDLILYLSIDKFEQRAMFNITAYMFTAETHVIRMIKVPGVHYRETP